MWAWLYYNCQHALREAPVQKRLFSRCFTSNDCNEEAGLTAVLSLFLYFPIIFLNTRQIPPSLSNAHRSSFLMVHGSYNWQNTVIEWNDFQALENETKKAPKTSDLPYLGKSFLAHKIIKPTLKA